jgi:hypothetical protein
VKSIVAFGGAVVRPLHATKARRMVIVAPKSDDVRAAVATFRAAGNAMMYIQTRLTMPDRDLVVSRKAHLPDAIRIERAKRLPELGPRILFFSGGTALRKLSPGNQPLPGSAIVRTRCPKIYIPNAGQDPEQRGMSVSDSVRANFEYVRRDAGENLRISDVVDIALLDELDETYGTPIAPAELAELGVSVVHHGLVTRRSEPWLDAYRLTELLLSLC